jgi:hypothetical protein
MTTDRGLSQLCGRLTYGVALELLFGFYQGEIGLRIGPGVTSAGPISSRLLLCQRHPLLTV